MTLSHPPIDDHASIRETLRRIDAELSRIDGTLHGNGADGLKTRLARCEERLAQMLPRLIVTAAITGGIAGTATRYGFELILPLLL